MCAWLAFAWLCTHRWRWALVLPWRSWRFGWASTFCTRTCGGLRWSPLISLCVGGSAGRRWDEGGFLLVFRPRKICLSCHRPCCGALKATTRTNNCGHGLNSRRHRFILWYNNLTGLYERNPPFRFDGLHFLFQRPLRALLAGGWVGAWAVYTLWLIMTVIVGMTHLATSGTGGSSFTGISAMTKSLTLITPQRVGNINWDWYANEANF